MVFYALCRLTWIECAFMMLFKRKKTFSCFSFRIGIRYQRTADEVFLVHESIQWKIKACPMICAVMSHTFQALLERLVKPGNFCWNDKMLKKKTTKYLKIILFKKKTLDRLLMASHSTAFQITRTEAIWEQLSLVI